MADEPEPWYRTLFGEDYLRVWARVLPPERTAAEVEGIVKLLEPHPGAAILDLACGHGRITIPLAERGYRMTGLDLSELFLQKAAAEAETRGRKIRWVHGDMREIPFRSEFDAVINIFTSFGYFDDEEDDLRVLQGVRRALRPGGRFLMEFIHRESLMRRFSPASVERFEDGLITLEERRFDEATSRTESRLTLLEPDGRRTEYRFIVRQYTLTELLRMHAAAGLTVRAWYGGLDGGPLTLDSRRLAILSERASDGEQASDEAEDGRARITGVQDVFFYVEDMARAVRFYRDTLGLRLVFQSAGWTAFDVAGVRVGLHASHGGTPRAQPGPAPVKGAVLTLRVADIDAAVGRLRRQGVRFIGGIERADFGSLVTFEDPEGNLLKLMQPPAR